MAMVNGEQQRRERILAVRAALRQVECPRCGAPAGKPCRIPNGKYLTGMGANAHQARRRLAAERGLYAPA